MVKMTTSQFSQDESKSNMIWNYSLNFSAIAPLEDIVPTDREELSKRTSLSNLYSNISATLNNIKKYL
jgi:hypothetical protein